MKKIFLFLVVIIMMGCAARGTITIKDYDKYKVYTYYTAALGTNGQIRWDVLEKELMDIALLDFPELEKVDCFLKPLGNRIEMRVYY